MAASQATGSPVRWLNALPKLKMAPWSLLATTQTNALDSLGFGFLAALRPPVRRSLAKGTYEPALDEAWAAAAINAPRGRPCNFSAI